MTSFLFLLFLLSSYHIVAHLLSYLSRMQACANPPSAQAVNKANLEFKNKNHKISDLAKSEENVQMKFKSINHMFSLSFSFSLYVCMCVCVRSSGFFSHSLSPSLSRTLLSIYPSSLSPSLSHQHVYPIIILFLSDWASIFVFISVHPA